MATYQEARGVGAISTLARLETLEDLSALIFFTTKKSSLEELSERDFQKLEQEIIRFREAHKRLIKRFHTTTLKWFCSLLFKLDSLVSDDAYQHFPYDQMDARKNREQLEQLTNELFDFSSCGQLVQQASQLNAVYLLEEIFSKIDLPLTYLNDALKQVTTGHSQIVALLIEAGAGLQMNVAPIEKPKKETKIPFVAEEVSATVLRDR